ncbi:hypothetical protein RBSH_00508 [Rhodopirellula baltica SH28]|uniref:Uncharacterized protein n=2 Tax=Rhodopirellula baltica TaxID=265606 RepID=F2B1L1_RHOBT|nr:hypothetical protein RBWH47_02713 [Rhodopirellula baltica WH47]EKK04087.1 hypothetical protein RBSH_00508 [Rhodopirellula baltica SH28]
MNAKRPESQRRDGRERSMTDPQENVGCDVNASMHVPKSFYA